MAVTTTKQLADLASFRLGDGIGSSEWQETAQLQNGVAAESGIVLVSWLAKQGSDGTSTTFRLTVPAATGATALFDSWVMIPQNVSELTVVTRGKNVDLTVLGTAIAHGGTEGDVTTTIAVTHDLNFVFDVTVASTPGGYLCALSARYADSAVP